MKLETKRLILRPPRKSDIEDLVEELNNLNVPQYTASIPYPYRRKDAEEWVSKTQKKSGSRKKYKDYGFSIELKSEKKVVGGIGLFRLKEYDKTGEMGAWVAEPYWRQGIISEANAAVIDFAFNKLRLRRIVLKAFTENKASNAVAKKFGFTYEGTERESTRAKSTGKVHSVNVYSLLGREWTQIKRRLK